MKAPQKPTQSSGVQQPQAALPPELLTRVISLHQAGHLDEAEALYTKLLGIYPTNVEILTLMGTLYVQRNNPQEAIRLLDQAITIQPGAVQAYRQRGAAYEILARIADALKDYDKVVALDPGNSDMFNTRGVMLYKLRQFQEAVTSYEKAIAIRPGYAEAYNNRSVALRELNLLDQAMESCNRAIVLNPRYTEAYVNRANIFASLNQYNEAVANLDKAIALNPGFVGAYVNRGRLMYDQKCYDEALKDYDRAIAVDPGHADAYCNKAFIRLLQGELQEGWRLYEWRWKVPKGVISILPQKPLWLGQESLAGKTILLQPEQGLGDTIQFCRYIPMVEALGAKVLLVVQPQLTSLISSLKGHYALLGAGNYTFNIDFRCPLMSLPIAFGTTINTIPSQHSYLAASAEKRGQWQARLGPRNRPRIGLAWSGSAGHQNDHNRSMPLKALLPLLQCEYDFYSLQTEVRPADRETLSQSRILSFEQEISDFSDTAALVSEMDIILSVDTSVVHLAGALGKPVWILLPFAPDYRWLLDREDSPWYPTARLFRQQSTGDWAGVIEKVKAELTSRLAS